MQAAWEAWLGLSKATEIARPLFQRVAATITFTVLNASRVAVNLTGYTAKFTAKNIETEDVLFDAACVISDAVNGVCTCALTAANLATAANCRGELNLNAAAGNISDRVEYRFGIVEAIDADGV